MSESAPKGSRALRLPRRIVQVVEPEPIVLEEFDPAKVNGKQVHEALAKHAKDHPTAKVAAEWLGPTGWVRFMTLGPQAKKG